VTTDSSASDLLSAVLASPHAVAVHDRASWVGLFTQDAVVNDPVGASPHTGRVAIERFYDTFIAPNTITFHVDHDFAAPGTILRDLTIEIRMSTGATVRVPMHLRYRMVTVDGELKIAHLAAYWELPAMVGKLLRTGPAGLGAGTKLGWLLLRNQGIAGLTGMARAATGVGRRGKDIAAQLLTAAAAGDAEALRELLGPRQTVQLCPGDAVTVAEFADRARGARQGKTIAAGRTVTTSIDLDNGPAVAVVEFAANAPWVESVSVFTETVRTGAE